MTRSNLHAATLRRIVARLEGEEGARISNGMTEAISAELRAHPDDAEPLASIAQAGDPWPPWLQDLLDRLLTRRMRGRVWRQIVAEVYAKVFN